VCFLSYEKFRGRKKIKLKRGTLRNVEEEKEEREQDNTVKKGVNIKVYYLCV
jgi:hypothetical protein